MNRASHCPFDLLRLKRETGLRHVEYHSQLPSTSTTALELLEPLLQVSPSLVLAERQTAGRGRKGNAWWSSPGALTFTYVTDAELLPIAAERRPLISLAAGLAVRDALQQIAPETTFLLKWPNDIFVGEQKICGILVEQHSQQSQQGVFIGIGINVNNSLRDAPAEISQYAASLFDLYGRTFELTELLILTLQRLESRVEQLTSQPRMALSEVNRHNLLTGRIVTIQLPDQQILGQCIGVDEDGQLVLQTQSGLQRCSGGTVLKW